VEDAGPLLTASLRIFSTHDRTGGTPTPSDWQVAWEDTGGGWVATEVVLIRFGQLKGEDARGQLPR
jgi:hypothetical protein